MKLTVLIVDADQKNGTLLAERLRKSNRVGMAYHTDRLGAALVLAKEADMVLLDPLLPEMDGKAFLERLLTMGLSPGVIVLSSFFSKEMLQEYDRLGAAFCMRKPVDLSALMLRIEEWADGNGSRLGGKRLELRKLISNMLLDMGMSTLSGYYDCCTAIEWLCGRRRSRGRITKELYPFIARTTGQTSIQVERNIRYAIEQMWQTADPETVELYFGRSIAARKSRPSNAIFLCTLAEYICKALGLMDQDLQ